MKFDPYKIFEIALLQSSIIPRFHREYHFHDSRQWRIDFCWPIQKLAVEIEGGSWINGGHTRGSGFKKDIEKYNTLSLMRYYLMRFTPQQVKKGEAILTIEEWFKGYQEKQVNYPE